jgi:hypothetical protein
MARAKKIATRAKRPAKKTKTTKARAAPPKRTVSRAKRPVAKALTVDERRKLLKPRSDYDDVIENAVRVWSGEQRVVKVPGLTAPKLATLLRRAQTALAREETVRQRMEARLRPLQDARLRAEDAAVRALLDLNAGVKLYGRNDPRVLEAFAFVSEHLTSARGAPAPDAESDGTESASES